MLFFCFFVCLFLACNCYLIPVVKICSLLHMKLSLKIVKHCMLTVFVKIWIQVSERLSSLLISVLYSIDAVLFCPFMLTIAVSFLKQFPCFLHIRHFFSLDICSYLLNYLNRKSEVIFFTKIPVITILCSRVKLPL